MNKKLYKLLLIVAILFLIVFIWWQAIDQPNLLAPITENNNQYDTNIETMMVRVYFGNSRLDPEASCDKVYPVARRVERSTQAARISLEELLRGVTAQEKNDDYFTSIPNGAKINSLVIENKTAFVDFSDDLEKGVGGSCRVLTIRGQIEATLKQFPTVDSVIISINGRIDDILQP